LEGDGEKCVVEEVLCKRWVGVRGVENDENGGGEKCVGWKKCCVMDKRGIIGLGMMRVVVEKVLKYRLDKWESDKEMGNVVVRVD
jgi:hypothetical protein